MTKINIQTSGGAGPLASGNLQIKNGLPIDATLQIVSDIAGNDSVLKISTEDVTNNGGGDLASNTAFGTDAFVNNISGENNTAIGRQSLILNSTGNSNSSLGSQSLNVNTTGNSNTATGREALGSNATGSNNSSVGAFSLLLNNSGSNNTAIGSNGLSDLSSGSNNTSVGQNTGRGITTGSNNTILGAGVTGLSATLANNIIIADGQGNRRINVDGTGNVGIGTTAPTSGRLQIKGTGNTDATNAIFADNLSGAATFAIRDNGNAFLAGNVGIGTSTPLSTLNVQKAVNTELTLLYSTNLGNNFTQISGGSVVNPLKWAAIKFIQDASDNAHHMTFSTASPSVDTIERMRITSAGNVGIGTTTQNAKLNVAETTATRVIALTGNSNPQGTAQNYRVVRQYSAVALGTILTIPFVSQGSLNSTTIIRIIGHSALFNNQNLPGFTADISVGHLSNIGTLNTLSSTGSIASITSVGSNLLITFGFGYTNINGSGIYVTLEYMTNNVGFSIDVPNIALN